MASRLINWLRRHPNIITGIMIAILILTLVMIVFSFSVILPSLHTYTNGLIALAKSEVLYPEVAKALAKVCPNITMLITPTQINFTALLKCIEKAISNNTQIRTDFIQLINYQYDISNFESMPSNLAFQYSFFTIVIIVLYVINAYLFRLGLDMPGSGYRQAIIGVMDLVIVLLIFLPIYFFISTGSISSLLGTILQYYNATSSINYIPTYVEDTTFILDIFMMVVAIVIEWSAIRDIRLVGDRSVLMLDRLEFIIARGLGLATIIMVVISFTLISGLTYMAYSQYVFPRYLTFTQNFMSTILTLTIITLFLNVLIHFRRLVIGNTQGGKRKRKTTRFS